MEEINNENTQKQYEGEERPFNYGMNNFGMNKPNNYGMNYNGMNNYGMHHNNDYDWNKHGNNWQGGYGPYFPGNFGGFYGWPWFLLALKSMSPRDLMRYKEEIDNMN